MVPGPQQRACSHSARIHPLEVSGLVIRSQQDRSYLPEKLQIVKPLEGEYHTQSNSVFNVEPGDKENQNPNNRYLILGNESNIFVKTSEFPKTLWRTSSLLEMQSLTRSQPQLRAPLALVTGLLEVSAQP